MKVCVDQTKCETAGKCVQICPEVFQFQEGSKKAVAVMPDVPAALEGACRDAALLCPVGAICITP